MLIMSTTLHMKFFEGLRRRSNGERQSEQEKIEQLQEDIAANVAEGENAQRKFQYTQKFNDESQSDVHEQIRLEVERDLTKAMLEGARRRLDHLVRLAQHRIEVIEAEAALAKLKGQSPPPRPESVAQRETAAREEVKELESRFTNIVGQLEEIHARLSAREQRLRIEFGLSKDAS